MKKIVNKMNMFIIAMMVSNAAFAAPTKMALNESALCKLIEEMGGIFGTLRILAFAGAAFTIAGWAWGFISKGEVKLDEVKNKGIGLLVGFILLFTIGTVLSVFMSQAGKEAMGCISAFDQW